MFWRGASERVYLFFDFLSGFFQNQVFRLLKLLRLKRAAIPKRKERFFRFFVSSFTLISLLGNSLSSGSIPALANQGFLDFDSSLGFNSSSNQTFLKPVEILEKRTENSKHFLMPDGSYQAVIYSGAVHFRDEKGTWQEIDNELVPLKTEVGYENKRGPVKVKFKLDTPTTSPISLTDSDYQVELDLLGAKEDCLLSYENEVCYFQALPEVDLSYKVEDSGIKEILVLESTSAPSSFTFYLKTHGLELRPLKEGGYGLFTPEETTPAFYLGSLLAYDSSVTASGEPVYCKEATLTVKAVLGGYHINYSLPDSWLKSPSRVYPVYIDPSITKGASADSYVSSKYPTTNYGGSGELKVGYYDSSSGHNRSFVRFDLSSLSEAYIKSATFSAYMFHQYYADQSTPTYLAKLTSSWSENGVTWGNKPTYTYLACQLVSGRGVWVNWNVTSLVQKWVLGEEDNYGLMMYQAEDGSENTTCWKKFYSSEYSDPDYRPKLVVYYDYPKVSLSYSTPPYIADDLTTVTVSLRVDSSYDGDIREIRLLPNYTSSDPSRYGGYFAWFSYDPGNSWIKKAVSPGYLAYYPSGYNTSKLTPLLNESSITDGSGYKTVTFKFRYKPSWGDVQNNDFDYYIGLGSGLTTWMSGWKNYNSNCDVLPKPVTNFTSTHLEGLSWWKEKDLDGDGKSDIFNDYKKVGRGKVTLNWESSGATAKGYTIYMFDGYAYRQVGKVFGSNNTSWNSEALGIYPGDSEIASYSLGTTSSPFYRALSPSSESKEGEFGLSGLSGTGVVLTDGTYLYVRRWGSYPGPDAWMKVGTGLNGTAKGKVYNQVGKTFSSSETIFSGFYLNGFLYGGRTVTADGKTIQGIFKGEAANSEKTRLFYFDQPLLLRNTGGDAGATGNLLLASDGKKIYSVAYSLGSGDYDGFRIRVFKVMEANQAKCEGTYDIPMESYYVDGVLADGEALYLIEWKAGNDARVTKVCVDNYKVINQWKIDQGNTRVINGCYDPANNLFWLGSLDAGKVYSYSGPGFDLRDNPQPLYQKMGGPNYDDRINYWFRVVPFNSAGSPNLSRCSPNITTLPNRSLLVNADPRHTAFNLPEIALSEASIWLDKASLNLSATDLSIESWGPKAQVKRVYSSLYNEESRFAFGWHFNFDSHLEVATSTVSYFDFEGEKHTFRKEGSSYFSPVGFYGELTETPQGYLLKFKDRSFLTFDSAGKLLSETDKNGNQVSYLWERNQLTIRAANGQEIEVLFSDEGKILSASLKTSAGRREVRYEKGETTASITYYPGTSDEVKVLYAYSEGKLTSASIPGFRAESSPQALWSFVYENDRLSEVRFPGYEENPFKRLEIYYGSFSASLLRYGEVNGTSGVAITETYSWNPDGTLSSRTSPKTSAEATSTWTFAYSPYGELVLERTPLGKEVKRIYDLQGNLLYEWDEEGHRTSYFYDQFDQLVKEVSPRGSTTYYTYDEKGNLLKEEKELSVEGDFSVTEYTYDGFGRKTSERKKIDSSNWQETLYSEFASNGEPQTITQAGVKLSLTSSPINLITRKVYDDFGSLILEIDPTDTTVTQNTYSVSGRLLTSVDSDGATTYYFYDLLGNEIESYKLGREGKKVGWVKKVFDAEGKELKETELYSDGRTHKVVSKTYDELGRELREEDSIEGATIKKYDARGNLTYELKAGETSPTTLEYDVEGNEIKEVSPDNQASGEATLSFYYPSGLLKKVVNPDSSWTEYRYDEEGNQIEEISPTEEGETVSTYYFYDLGGRLIKEVSAEGLMSAFTHDLLGNQLSSSIEGEAQTTNVYNSLGWVLKTTEPDGVVVQKTYDKAGRVVSETRSGKGSTGTTSYSYDSKGRLLKQVNPDGTEVEYSYDEFGREVRETHRKGGLLVKDLETSYDELDREVKTVDYKTGVKNYYSYAEGSNKKGKTTLCFAEATTTILYDSNERELSRSVLAFGLSLETSVTSRTPSGLLAGQSFKINGFSLPSFSYTYNSLGQVASQSGPGFSSLANYDYYDEDTEAATSRKKSEVLPLSFGGTITANYFYTPGGRLSTATINGLNYTYRYTPSGFITTATVGSNIFSFRESTTYPGAVARLIGGGKTISYSYDSLGRRKERRTTTSTTTYLYSEGLDRLTTVTISNEATITYSYDASGQRTQKVVIKPTQITTTTFVYDGLKLLQMRALENEVTETVLTYFYDENQTPLAFTFKQTNRDLNLTTTSTVFLLTNQRKDVLGLLDEKGHPFATYSYDPYGNLTHTQVTTTTLLSNLSFSQTLASLQPLRYSSYFFDSETSLYYLSQRYYDPETYSFLSKDPAKADGEESTYQYCGGDPVNFFDPSGLYILYSGRCYRPTRVTRVWYTRWHNLFGWSSAEILGHSVSFRAFYRYKLRDRLYEEWKYKVVYDKKGLRTVWIGRTGRKIWVTDKAWVKIKLLTNGKIFYISRWFRTKIFPYM